MVIYSGVPEPYSRNPGHIEFGEELNDMANVTVMGGVQVEYGLKTAQKVQVKHNEDVAAALLNISGVGTVTGGPVHQDENRPAYVHADFPCMLYKPYPGEKGQLVVLHKAEMEQALRDGWREKPYPVVQVEVNDPAREKKALLDKNNELESKLIQQAEALEKMQAQMAELLAKKK